MRDHTRSVDTLTNNGYGAPFKATGMICSAFRNSDDATTFLYNIPDNLFAVTSLCQLAEMLDVSRDQSGLASTCRNLAAEVEKGLKTYGPGKCPPRRRADVRV